MRQVRRGVVLPVLPALLLPALLLLACGDRSNAVKLDGGGGDQGGPDQGILDQGPQRDVGPWQELGPDLFTPDGAVPDLPSTDGPVAKVCAKAIPLTLTAGQGQASGTILATATDNDLTLPSSSCVGSTTSGADRFYKVDLVAGKTYVVSVSGGTTPPFQPALYVFSSCADPATSCLAGAGEKVSTQAVIVKPKTSGAHYIGVDSVWPLGLMYAYGDYTVTVMEATGFETCSGALKLSWGGGTTISTAGDTTSAAADLDVGYSCTGGKGTAGADLFYAVPVTAGQSYKITVTPLTSWNPSVYALSGCANPSSSCVAGADYAYDGQPEQLILTATSTGDLVIGVDSAYYPFPPPGPPPMPNAAGPFLLTIEAFTPSGNDTCAKPQALSWSGTKATASGDTSTASPMLSMTGSCLTTPSGTPGRDLFYSVTVTAGKGYKVTVTPSSAGPFWNPAIYVFTDCTNPAATCLAGSDFPAMPGSGVETSFVASATGSVIIGVDSMTPPGTSYGAGAFTLSVEEYVPPTNDLCTTPQALTWSGSKATASGDTTQAANSVSLTYSACTKTETPGADLFYSVAVTAGQSYKVTVSPTGSWNPALYVFSSCSNVVGTCLAGADIGPYNGPETVTFTAASSGSVIIGVDSSYPVGPKPGSGGAFTLTVEEFTPPSNGSCSSPQTMSWSGGKATASGDTSLSSNELSGIKCGGPLTFEGPQLYYQVALTAGKTYLATLTPATSYDGALYAFPAATACSATAINPACYYTYSLPNVPGAPDTITITPGATGDWVIAVDSASPGDAGTFTLTVEEFTPPQNDTCAGAQALVFNSSGVASVNGSTLVAADDLTLTNVPCVPGITSGPDLFYSASLTGGKTYTIMLMPDKSFDPVLYVLSGCASPASSCLQGSSNKGVGMPEMITFTPAASGTYLIVVDAYGYTVGGTGTFTLTVQ